MSSPATDVELVGSPWPDGKRTICYYGPVHAEIHVRGRDPRRWYRAVLRLRRKLRQQARQMSRHRATHVVSVEETVDPFVAGGVLFHAIGTAAWMEDL